MDVGSTTVGNYVSARKLALLARWRELVRADSRLSVRRLALSDRDLENHFPSLLDQIVAVLKGEPMPEGAICQGGARHGRSRLEHHCAPGDLIQEFSLFKKVLREVLDEQALEQAQETIFTARASRVRARRRKNSTGGSC